MKKRKAVMILLTFWLLNLNPVFAQEGNSPVQLFPSESPGVVIPVDSDWSTSTSTNDCATGLADDSWLLTLTEASLLTVSAVDCCCPGDFFEIVVNSRLIGTTPNLAPPWGCDFAGPNSSGSFTLPLCPGDHTITVRDAGFDGHTIAEISEQRMCPAAFTVTGTLTPFSPRSSQFSLLSSQPMQSDSRPVPRTAEVEEIVETLRNLSPFIRKDRRNIQHLDVEAALDAELSMEALEFGHKLVTLNNKVVMYGFRNPDAFSDSEFEFAEEYFLYLVEGGEPCGGFENPSACPPRVPSGACFNSREKANMYLREEGFHRTSGYAGGSLRNDYTRFIPVEGCPFLGAFRTQAIVHRQGDFFTFNIQEPEPNPELHTYDWPSISWPAYVAWWHFRFC